MLGYEKVVTCSRDPVIKIFDLAEAVNQEAIASLEGHEMPVTAIGVSHDHKKIASGGRDCTCRIWDIEKEKTVAKRKI